MARYTKPLVKITPLRVGDCQLIFGRSAVELLVEYEGGHTETVRLMLPLKRKRGDTLVVAHSVAVDISDQKMATLADTFMGMIGFRNTDETVQ